MPGDTGVTVVTILVCSFYFACEAAGAHGAPGIPCALRSEEGRTIGVKLARRRGEVAEPCPCTDAT